MYWYVVRSLIITKGGEKPVKLREKPVTVLDCILGLRQRNYGRFTAFTRFREKFAGVARVFSKGTV
jgi:hypothetical protein